MAVAAQQDWIREFGLDARQPPSLFTSKEQIKASTHQAHLLRRAFDVLEVDGILCVDHSPLAYFRVLRRTTPASIVALHKRFWNHGGASLLVLITDDRVHVYSGMSRPEPDSEEHGEPSSHVVTLERLASRLKEFVVAIESGEFFQNYQRSFDPAQRVDRDLLNNLRSVRAQLDSAGQAHITSHVIDALLCRLVFACYLFDREVIGGNYLRKLNIAGASHVRDLLGMSPTTRAKAALYRLFEKLKEDFNGDLFSSDLIAERDLIQDVHLDILNEFFRGTNVEKGQKAFWPYSFKYIPIETISAIYERFLKVSDELPKHNGVFYTPRFLAEVVIDTALEGVYPLIGKRFLDPACGSGIFLVGLFNRLAEEWKIKNPLARNDRKARELMRVLRESLFGVDISLAACRIAAFSLYLAYLDHLSPPDIQALQEQGRALPRLVATRDDLEGDVGTGNIRQADFFAPEEVFPKGVSLVIGNPPWRSTAGAETPAGRWCAEHSKPLPDNQIAAAFVWKAAEHLDVNGRVCFVLPHGLLFNHSATALKYQRAWVEAHALDRVLNLADYQRFLFDRAGHPAVVVCYRKYPPSDREHRIEYWGPKAGWTVTKAEVISILPQDRTTITVGELLRDLDGPDAPQIWKQQFWATPRDWRLLDRLRAYPRLRDHVRYGSESDGGKPWRIAEGFQPFGKNDPPNERRYLTLPSRRFIAATSKSLDLFLLERDCTLLPSSTVEVRRKLKRTDIFRKPHVLVAKGFTSIAFADFHVSFQHALRGIHGPSRDRDLLVFLAAYLRTAVARYFMFHTSSNWGISRQEVHVEEMLRLPFPFPEQQPDPKRARQIIREVASIVGDAARQADADLADRTSIVSTASVKTESLIDEYFDILPLEKLLVNDTVNVIIESVRPTRDRPLVPTMAPVSPEAREAYVNRVCKMLNDWARRGPFAVRGEAYSSQELGVGVAVYERVDRTRTNELMPGMPRDLLRLLDRVRKAVPKRQATLDIVRGVMVFDRNLLYLVKPIGQRFWTQTAAMNDADEIAGTILMPATAGKA